MASRGSVIPLFIDQIKHGEPLTVTDPNMTRFLMNLYNAVELVVFAFQNAKAGDIMVQKSPACTVGILAQAVKELFGYKGEIRIIGTRHGEKLYETLLTSEQEYNSHNTRRLTLDEVKEKLLELEYVQQELKGWN